MMLTQRNKVSASLSGASSGSLNLEASNDSVSASIRPFFKGDPGMTPQEIEQQIAAGLAQEFYDYDAIVATNLGV